MSADDPNKPVSDSTGIPPAPAEITRLADEVLAPMRDKLHVIVKAVEKEFAVAFWTTDPRKRNRVLLEVRHMACALAVEFLSPPLTRESIAFLLDIPEATFYRHQARCKQREQRDPAWRARLDKVRGGIPA